MATGGASFSKDEQRTVVRFLWATGMSGKAIHDQLESVCGDSSMSQRSVYDWVKRFKEGKSDGKDAPRSGRPRIIDDDLTNEVGAFVRENRNCTLDDVAARYSVSEGTAHAILSLHLNMRKLKQQWVPHTLTTEHRETRVRLSTCHLQREQREGARFLERIVAGDETWVKSFEPELPQQTAIWRGDSFGKTTNAPVPQFVKPTHSFKVMHIVFFDHQGILLDHAVPHGTTVTSEYYRAVLRDNLRPAIRKKRPQLLQEGVILLHDNALPHVAQIVKDQLASWGWESLDHPPYSPDLSPCDFFLFGRLKSKLRGRDLGTE